MSMADISLCCAPLRHNACRWVYFAAVALSWIFCWLFRETGNSFQSVSSMDACRSRQGISEDESNQCYAKEAVLRMAFATFIFFAAHFAVIAVLLAWPVTRHGAARAAHAGASPAVPCTQQCLRAHCATSGYRHSCPARAGTHNI